MTKGFSMGEIAKILLVIFVLVVMIMLFVTQRDKIGAMLSRTSDIGGGALDEAGEQLAENLGITLDDGEEETE